ncbi:MAG TPA: DDE-type integrase/transposase/recombinase [Solirubrobacteraceae bacterium]|nr:DDE-type integrase/transposase/recombinase [Solirubrobacteraceae bacterium]
MSTEIDAEARRFLLERLREYRSRGERVPNALVTQVAGWVGKSERTVWRWIKEAPTDDDGEHRGYRLTDRDVELFYALRGNVAAVWREAHRGSGGVSRQTLQRAFKEQMTNQERAYAVTGSNGQRRYTLSLRWEPPYRNALWEADHKEIPVEVIPPRGTKLIRPWVTVFLDGKTRGVMGYSVNEIQTAADVHAALRQAIEVVPERGPFGGKPDAICWDNGKEFLAGSVTDVAARLGIMPLPADPYQPQQKGKIERFNRTLEESFLAHLPGYQNGARRADSSLYGTADRLSMESFVALLEEFIREYNCEREHSSLDGRTPEQAWLEDPTQLHLIAAERLRWLTLARATCKVQKDGIHHAKQRLLAPELTAMVGEEVEIYFMPHDGRLVEVFSDGKHLCTAMPQDQLSNDQLDDLLARREAERRRAAGTRRRVSRNTRVRYAPATGPGPVEVSNAVSAEQARREGLTRSDLHLVQPTADLAGDDLNDVLPDLDEEAHA